MAPSWRFQTWFDGFNLLCPCAFVAYDADGSVGIVVTSDAGDDILVVPLVAVVGKLVEASSSSSRFDCFRRVTKQTKIMNIRHCNWPKTMKQHFE
jgi:hypothetical protein